MSALSLVFLKLGGSLITDKNQAHTPRLEVIARLADEIAAALQANPALQLLLGHGSGSFGHVPAKKYATRLGVHSEQEWRGFTEVWQEAAALNRLVMVAFSKAGLKAVAFPPSASVTTYDGKVIAWDTAPIRAALANGLLPVVYGDVVFDTLRGGTILSTEDLFEHLAPILAPQRILLCGKEPGVWLDYPVCTKIAQAITPGNLQEFTEILHGSAAADVTGGMESKVRQAMVIIHSLPGSEALIFSGQEPGVLTKVLTGEQSGTLITSPV